MKNYAVSRLSPWLGHLMVSRQETARPLLTPGEVMQLPPTDEIVMVAGTPPIRAKKARYYEDARFTERILPAPALASLKTNQKPDDWTVLPPPPIETEDEELAGAKTDDDPVGAGHKQEPELDPAQTVKMKAPLDNEFEADPHRGDDEYADQVRRSDRLLQRASRQAALDRGDGMSIG
jgi:type IV secretion system protein VirD4